jgi:hypothetical protein
VVRLVLVQEVEQSLRGEQLGLGLADDPLWEPVPLVVATLAVGAAVDLAALLVGVPGSDSQFDVRERVEGVEVYSGALSEVEVSSEVWLLTESSRCVGSAPTP